MKRSRNDQILACVNHYLRHRQFTDFNNLSESKIRESGECDMEGYLVREAVRHSDSNGDMISYSSLHAEPSTTELQYNKLRLFVADSIEPYHTELSHLLYPVYVHFFLELISSGYKQQGQKFLTRHQSLFMDSDDKKPLMALLSTVSSREDIRHNRLISEFSEKKYRVDLSDTTFQYLMKYFQKDDCMLTLQIISRHIDISVCSDADSHETLHVGCTADDDDGMTDDSYIIRPPPPLTTQSSVVISSSSHQGSGLEVKPAGALETGLTGLQRIIQRVESGPPSLPSVCLYTLRAPSRCITACLSYDASLLSAGFDDSSLYLCHLSAQRSEVMTRPHKCRVRISQVHLAGDYYDDVEEKICSEGDAGGRMFGRGQGQGGEGSVLRGHSANVYSACFMHNNKLLLSASADKTIRLWDVATCSNIVKYTGHTYHVFDVDACDVSEMFVSCSYDQTARLWSTDRIFPLRVFIGHTRSVSCVRFHPNGQYIATASSDGTVRMWSVQDAQPVRLFHSRPTAAVTALQFSPNGKYVASAGDDGDVLVWDLASGALLKRLKGHTDVVYDLQFNSLSSVLTSGGLDGSVKLWDMRETSPVPTPAAVINCNNKSTNVTSPELLASYATGCSPILSLKFSTHNFLQVIATQQ